jgi:hypothetical protein
MHLSHAPAPLFDLVARENGLDLVRSLAPAERASLFRKLGAVSSILSAGYGSRGAVVSAQSSALGVGQSTLNSWLAAYKAEGFRGLIDGRTIPGERETVMPAVTKGWIRDQILNVQRNDGIREVRRLALDRWRLWRRSGDPKHRIPGYSVPPPDCGKGYPAGWSYEQFRRCRPDRFRETLGRQGRIAADRLLPSIMRTRVGVPYLGYVFFDDQVYDHQVREPNYDRPMRPVGFNSLDRLTAYPFTPHIRLRWWDENSEIHRALTQREFVWHVFNHLCTEGYRADEHGTVLVFEHGTANSWSNQQLTTSGGHHNFADALAALTSGQVTIDRSGIYNRAIFPELLHGPQPSGNPRFKAPIESFFHLVRTYHLCLPGQTGRNRDEAPEDSYGLAAYERQTLKLAQSLPPALREAVASTLYSFREFGALAFLIYDALASRTDHALEGWAECGFTEIRWRWHEDPPDLWRPRSLLADLPEHVRATASAQQAANPHLVRQFNLSPAEARARCAADPDLARLSRADAWLLLPLEWAQPVTVRDKREIVICDPLCGHGQGNELIYLPEVTNLAGRTEYLHPGDKILALVDPFHSDTLMVADQSGRPIGTCLRSVREHGTDRETVAEMFRIRGRTAAALGAQVRAAMAPVAADRTAVRDANKSLAARLADTQDDSPDPSAPSHSADIPAPSPRRAPDSDPFAAPLAAVPAANSPEPDPFV